MLLTVENVTLKFDSLIAVNNVSTEIQKGEITALIGPNGAGKTTFFNVISGALQPNEGSIIFDGQDITSLKDYQINQVGISRTYQVINLFKTMSVIENVMVGMHSKLKSNFINNIFRTPAERIEEKEAYEKCYELLSFVNLQDKYNDRADSLSYGDQRRLEIVRGMASDPKLILLDEPAAGLNSTEKNELDVLIHKIVDLGISVLLIEHDMKLIMGVADKIIVLNYGKKIAEGVPVDIQKNEDVIAAYLGT